MIKNNKSYIKKSVIFLLVLVVSFLNINVYTFDIVLDDSCRVMESCGIIDCSLSVPRYIKTLILIDTIVKGDVIFVAPTSSIYSHGKMPQDLEDMSFVGRQGLVALIGNSDVKGRIINGIVTLDADMLKDKNNI